ncbi:hypothetical protein [Chitinibacter sp. S2-10]|uniref:hypothetical protein n=1 Tax=Chitinibacter sp. S2-10 TaxID=3373597 RepID=UPI0039777BFB
MQPYQQTQLAIQQASPPAPNIRRPPGRQLVRDISEDFSLLQFLTRHGWRITDADYKAGWYWAQRTSQQSR